MCGISGLYRVGGTDDYQSAVRAMNRAMGHRGPDYDGCYAEPGLALGHRRLSIIDLSAAGNQPMISLDGNWVLIFNGEIYNYRELKKELSHYKFQTGSDSEVLLAAWMTWGKAALQRLQGMFAFAIWNKAEQRLTLVRDRLGIKPIYIYRAEGQLAFASEVRALCASQWFQAKLNRAALSEYLRYQTVYGNETLLQGVELLGAGTYLEIDAQGCRQEQWWKPSSTAVHVPSSYSEICKDVRHLLHEAVESRLVADVPFGAFLSGGIDSSAVVGLMREVATSPVNTFSITFDDSEFSEAVYARMIAKRFQTNHHEIQLRPNDFLQDLPAGLAAMDHPSGDGLNTFIVSKHTKAAGVTMALSGLGGDELFAGYAIFKQAYALNKKTWLNTLPRGLRKTTGRLLQFYKPGISSAKMAEILGLRKITFDSYYPLSRLSLMENQVSQILRPNCITPEIRIGELARQHELECDAEHFLSRVSLAEIETYMQSVLLRDTDQMSMAHALEVRVPFLDYRLVEYVLSVPDAHKFPLTPKRLLTDALGDLLPREIIDRPKMGFTLPWKNWMKTELRSFCESQLVWLGDRDEFQAEGIQKLWNAFLNDDPHVTWSRIWHLVVLSNWLQRHDIA